LVHCISKLRAQVVLLFTIATCLHVFRSKTSSTIKVSQREPSQHVVMTLMLSSTVY